MVGALPSGAWGAGEFALLTTYVTRPVAGKSLAYGVLSPAYQR